MAPGGSMEPINIAIFAIFGMLSGASVAGPVLLFGYSITTASGVRVCESYVCMRLRVRDDVPWEKFCAEWYSLSFHSGL